MTSSSLNSGPRSLDEIFSAGDSGAQAAFKFCQVDFKYGGANGLAVFLAGDGHVDLGAPCFRSLVPLRIVDEHGVRGDEKRFLVFRFITLPVVRRNAALADVQTLIV